MLKKFICVLRNIFYTISGKFILLSSALTFVSLVVITMFYLDSYDKATESNVYDISNNIATVMNSHIDYMAQDVVDISTFLLTSQIVQEALQFPIYDNYGKPYSSQHYNEANQMLINLINSQTYLGCIYLGNEDISFYQRKVGCSFDFKELYSQEKESTWLTATKAAGGRGVWFSAAESDSFEGDIMIHAKVLNSLTTLKPIGLLVIGFDRSALNDIVLSMKSSLPMSVVIRREGEIIYSIDTFRTDKAESSGYMDFLDNENGFYTAEDSTLYYLTSNTSNRMGWEVTVAIDCNQYEVTKQNVVTTNVFLIVIVFFIGLFCAALISRTVTEQLTKLRKYVKELKDNHKMEQIIFTTKDEIGLIGNEFMNVVNENNRLISNLYEAKFREKEAELISLQAQINPHFLYNTLDTIFWMATDARQEKIANVSVALSRLFRLSLNKGEQITDIISEIEIIKYYVYIQNIRYDNRFSVTYQIPNELYSCRIIKFILQPLIENSIYHGLEKKEGKGSILIRVSREENFLYIIVQDDGVGFDSSCMNVVDSGYAIRNIQERIRLYYGEGCGLFFESTIGKGCKVTIKIKLDVNPELPGNNEL